MSIVFPCGLTEALVCEAGVQGQIKRHLSLLGPPVLNIYKAGEKPRGWWASEPVDNPCWS